MANRGSEFSGLTGGWVLDDVVGDQPVVLGLSREENRRLTSTTLASTVDGSRALRSIGAVTGNVTRLDEYRPAAVQPTEQIDPSQGVAGVVGAEM